jgi:hypothetical protein
MLRPGGRLVSVNMQSFHSDSYSLTNPYWFLDFFTVNGFADCRVYATTHGDAGELNVYAVDPTARRDRAFRPLEVTGVLVFAEKGINSTWEAIPSQRYYSAADEIEKRVAVGRRFAASGRPELLTSIDPKPFSRLRQIQQVLLAENRTVEDFRLLLAGGQKVKVPASWMLSIARVVRRFGAWRSDRR